MKPKYKRYSQLSVGIIILSASLILGYYSIEEKDTPKYDIYLVIDTSGSMDDQGKLNDAKNAANMFIDSIGSNDHQVGLAVFADQATLLSKTSNSVNLKNQIQSLQAGGDTAMGDAIKIVAETLQSEGRHDASKTILLLTDGMATAGIDPIQAATIAKQNDVTIFTVGYGYDADANTLNTIATMTDGKYFQAQSGQELISVFNNIAKSLISPAAHYGSRILILIAVPILLFMPTLEKMAVTMIQKAEETFIDRKRPSTKNCSKCTYSNRINSKFCAKCGNKIWLWYDKKFF